MGTPAVVHFAIVWPTSFAAPLFAPECPESWLAHWETKFTSKSRIQSDSAAFFFTTLLFQWDFSHRKFPGESQLWQSRATQPMVHAGCFSFFHNTPNSDKNYGIFNVRTHVNACNCTRGCRDTVESLHWKLILGEKTLAAPENWTPSAVCRRDALPTELHPHPER